jgi:hypothetical protein
MNRTKAVILAPLKYLQSFYLEPKKLHDPDDQDGKFEKKRYLEQKAHKERQSSP